MREHAPLSEYTTIRSGGAARWFAVSHSVSDLKDALTFARNHQLRVFILGGGSNVLISDQGFNGLVIQVAIDDVLFEPSGVTTVGAGMIWDQFVESACQRGLSGIESLSGIPGRVGATPIQNVGAYGQDVGETITHVHAIHSSTFETRVFTGADCAFGYRQSVFKSLIPNPWIITSVTFQLEKAAMPSPKYEELKYSLQSDPKWDHATREERILAIRRHVLKIRAQKGMVLNPDDPDTKSVGSFFVNPVVTTSEKDRIYGVAAAKGAHKIPTPHPAGDNLWKLSAAWLIETSGIHKGHVLGTARVSTKHVLAITNPNGGTTTDILALADHIQKSVFNTFAVKLEREPVYVG